MSNIGFLTLGFAVVWVIIAGYVWFIARRQSALRRQLDQLELELDETAAELDRDAAA
jgi:CcmD family protein